MRQPRASPAALNRTHPARAVRSGADRWSAPIGRSASACCRRRRAAAPRRDHDHACDDRRAGDLEMIRGTRAVLALLAGKWSVDILYLLATRHPPLQRGALRGRRDLQEDADPDAALARAGRPRRPRVLPEIPVRVEYSLTPLGWSITGPLMAMYEWAAQHLAAWSRTTRTRGVLMHRILLIVVGRRRRARARRRAGARRLRRLLRRDCRAENAPAAVVPVGRPGRRPAAAGGEPGAGQTRADATRRAPPRPPRTRAAHRPARRRRRRSRRHGAGRPRRPARRRGARHARPRARGLVVAARRRAKQ